MNPRIEDGDLEWLRDLLESRRPEHISEWTGAQHARI